MHCILDQEHALTFQECHAHHVGHYYYLLRSQFAVIPLVQTVPAPKWGFKHQKVTSKSNRQNNRNILILIG